MTMRAFSKVSSFPCEIWVVWEAGCVALGWDSCGTSGISVSASSAGCAACELLTCFL